MEILLENVSANKDKWLSLREGKIGASEAYDAADLGLDADPLKIFLKLMGRAEPLEDNEPMYYGRHLENFVGEEFCRQYITDHPGAEVVLLKPDVYLSSSSFPFAASTPDFDVVINGVRHGLQTKTTDARNAERWEGGLPDRVRAQCLHEMAVDEESAGVFAAAFIYKPTFRYHYIERNALHIAELMRREKDLFDLYEKKTPPPLKHPTSENLKAMFWETDGSTVLLPSTYELEIYEKAKFEVKKWEHIKDMASARICELIGNADKGVIENWKVSMVRSEFESIDMKELKAGDKKLHEVLLGRYKKVTKRMYPRITAPKAFQLPEENAATEDIKESEA